MTEENREQLSEDELAAVEGEALPAREVMSTILVSPDLPPPPIEEAAQQEPGNEPPPEATGGQQEPLKGGESL